MNRLENPEVRKALDAMKKEMDAYRSKYKRCPCCGRKLI